MSEINVLFLCAGFGTRILKEMEQYPSFKHLLHLPKPLLPIPSFYTSSKETVPLLTIWVEFFLKQFDKNKMYLITNGKYIDQYKKWLKEIPVGNLLNNGALENSKRQGACFDLYALYQHIPNHQNNWHLVIAGDLLLFPETSLEPIIDFPKLHRDSNLLLYYQCSDEETHKCGILTLEKTEEKYKRVLDMKEKPGLTTESRNACPCLYLLNDHTMQRLQNYLKPILDIKNRNEEVPAQLRDKMDAPGTFINWLIQTKNADFYAFEIKGRFDIGDLKSYWQCLQLFR